jgi:hypothetical protein
LVPLVDEVTPCLPTKTSFFIIIENSSILKPVCVGGEEYPRGWKKKHVERGVKQGRAILTMFVF